MKKPSAYSMYTLVRKLVVFSIGVVLTETFDDVEELVNIGVARKERITTQHLGEEASDGPHIHGSLEKKGVGWQ